ncbi:MAG: hypothetical protein ACYDBP_14740, partial [Leptospirales bacterium]
MKYLYMDSIGLMLDMAMRTKQSRLAIMDKHSWPNIGNGIVERDKHPDITLLKRWPDVVVYGDVGYGKKADELRSKDWCGVIGGNQETDKLELNRLYGQQKMKEAGIPTLPAYQFSDLKKAREFVNQQNKVFVSKPNDDKNDKSLSYVPHDLFDLNFMMDRWEKTNKIKSPFLLQEKVKGREMAVGGWWTPDGWLSDMACENFEFKKFMAGDIGMNTGESGTVLKYVPIDKSKIAKQMMRPLEKILKKTSYIGYMDINCIIDEDGKCWPLELTSRFGYPTFSIQQALHEKELDVFWESLLTGWSFPFNTHDLALGIVVAIPDYPYSKATSKEVEGFPVRIMQKTEEGEESILSYR